jgi:hypothetical protein
MLVGVSALLAQISVQQELDFAEAVSDLTEQPLGVLLFVVFALILTTMITQAFQFEVIRILEGYWGTTRPTTWIADLCIEAHIRRRDRLADRVEQARRSAFAAAREEMLDKEIERMLIDILESDFRGQESPSSASDTRVKEARSMGWHVFAPPSMLRRVDSAKIKLDMYPERYRLLPTLLGNTLRSFEDELTIADGGDLQGFIMRNYDKISPTLLARQAQFRTRLDMYCTLVLVYGLLGLASLPAFWRFAHLHLASFLAFALFSVLAVVSYAAAISSACGYGSTLAAIDTQVTTVLRQAGSSVTVPSKPSSENA